MRVLVLGDIVGRPGRTAIERRLASFRAENQIDFCIANGENIAGGAGLTVDGAKSMLKSGVDVLTTGDHVFKKKEIIPFMETTDRLLRPANLSPLASGRGYTCIDTPDGHRIGVLNLLGRSFVGLADCPYRAATDCVSKLREQTPIIIVDFHAEATSEKTAMGWHLDGKVSLVAGTHTHIQTADERVLPNGTAYITDLGMTGPYDSVIGRRADRVLKHLLTQMPTHFDVAKGNVKICGVIATIDPDTGRALDIGRVQVQADKPDAENPT